jgi:sigma-54 dependent transcriptional regulator, acetoin dehydrogenase operon transcriptional activator AcoR
VLVRHFLRLAGAPEAELGMSFMAGLVQWDWPHNVRELDATMRRAVAIAKGAALSIKHLPDALRESMRDYGAPAAPAAPPQRRGPAPDELRALLDRHKGNVAAVARELQRDRAQIRRWMRYAGIDPDKHRG